MQTQPFVRGRDGATSRRFFFFGAARFGGDGGCRGGGDAFAGCRDGDAFAGRDGDAFAGCSGSDARRVSCVSRRDSCVSGDASSSDDESEVSSGKIFVDFFFFLSIVLPCASRAVNESQDRFLKLTITMGGVAPGRRRRRARAGQ